MSKITRLADNQYVFGDNNKKSFQSYDSIIAVIEKVNSRKPKLTLGKNWDYSKTTTKYLYQFLRTYFGWENPSKKSIETAIKNKEITYNENLV